MNNTLINHITHKYKYFIIIGSFTKLNGRHAKKNKHSRTVSTYLVLTFWHHAGRKNLLQFEHQRCQSPTSQTNNSSTKKKWNIKKCIYISLTLSFLFLLSQHNLIIAYMKIMKDIKFYSHELQHQLQSGSPLLAFWKALKPIEEWKFSLG